MTICLFFIIGIIIEKVYIKNNKIKIKIYEN